MDDVELLSRLVAFDTVSHRSNLALVDFLCEYAGTRAERVPSPDGRKANLVLRFGPDEGDGLVFCGHMDVVPAEEEGWRSDPFRLREGEGRLFSRGACDMKGFLAVATNLAKESRGLRGPLVLLFTYDEEVGTAGARDLVERWPLVETLPRRAIIGEPTELRVVRMHKGHVRVRITMHGVSAHSALPHLGRNAIEPAARVLVSLRGLPVTNADFSRALGHALGRPSWLPAPAFALKTLLGEMADSLLLSGQRVIPQRALEGGFNFTFPTLELALADILE